MTKIKLNKTGVDYKKELLAIENDRRALEARVKERAEYLCRTYPHAPIGMGAVAREIVKFTTADSDDYINIIIAIEKYLVDQHPHKQTTITF
jgi:hypothetical protein